MTNTAQPPATQPTPEITPVAPGIWGLRLPLPFQLNHINVWLLEDCLPDGQPAWTLIDTGVANARTRELWEAVAADFMQGRPVRHVIVTHFHPDHIGLADWLCRRFAAPLSMTRTEWMLARMLSLDSSAEITRTGEDFYASMGLEPDLRTALAGRSSAYARGVPHVPARYDRLREGDDLLIGNRRWTIMTLGGHSPEHACLFSADDDILIAGDMVLPRISPNVSVWPNEPLADPLAEYLEGLSRLRTLPAQTLVLPSHGEPFRTLHERIDELACHHRERLDAAVAFCTDTGRTIADVTWTMFSRNLDAHQLSFAAGEALAHLNCLERHGRLRRRRQIDGVWLFSAV